MRAGSLIPAQITNSDINRWITKKNTSSLMQ